MNNIASNNEHAGGQASDVQSSRRLQLHDYSGLHCQDSFLFNLSVILLNFSKQLAEVGARH